MKLYTIGHSNQDAESFIALLNTHKIEVIADVRSQPYSKFTPQFNREVLQVTLKQNGIQYVFLGDELGARRKETSCYRDGKVDFRAVTETPTFLSGIERLRKGVMKFKVAMMCAEKDPSTCHRTLLISRYLTRHSFSVQHITDQGFISQSEIEDELMIRFKLAEPDMFKSRETLVDEAYELQWGKIAYSSEGQA